MSAYNKSVIEVPVHDGVKFLYRFDDDYFCNCESIEEAKEIVQICKDKGFHAYISEYVDKLGHSRIEVIARDPNQYYESRDKVKKEFPTLFAESEEFSVRI